MHRAFLVALALAVTSLWGAPPDWALAGPRPPAHAPRVRIGTPILEARRQLIAQGFLPIRILSEVGMPPECESVEGFCAVLPEMEACATDRPYCTFLYQRQADGSFWLVQTTGEAFNTSPGELRHMRYTVAFPAESLGRYVVVLPDGSTRTLQDQRKAH